MVEQTKLTLKSFILSALMFTFSDKKQLLFSLLSFLLPFLFFFPTLFIGLTVQSSFLVEYQNKNSLLLDNQYSIFYNKGFTNSSLIPDNFLKQIDDDIFTIISLSQLSNYIDGYQLLCRMEQFFYYQREIFQQCNVLFLENNTFSQLAQYFTIQNQLPTNISEAVYIQVTDARSESPYLANFTLGNTISIFPLLDWSSLIENGSFLLPPLNVTISNIFSVNEIFLEGTLKEHSPFTFRMINQFTSETDFPILLFPLDFLIDYSSYFADLSSAQLQIVVQLLYDFSEFRVKDLRSIYQFADNLPNLSGYSESGLLYAYVTTELSDFFTAFKQEILLQWFRLFALAFLVLVFSLFILWLSFSSNTLKLSDIYANFLSKGFPPKIILRIFSFSRFIELLLSCVLGLVLSIPITYAILGIISALLNSTFLSLNLVSFGAVVLPSLLFFLFLSGFSYINQLLLIKKVQRFFPERLSSFQAVTSDSTKTQVLVCFLTILFSGAGAATLLSIRSLVTVQTVLIYEVLFVLDIFLYLFLVIAILSFLYLLVNFLLSQLIKQAHSLWKRASHKFSLTLHNLSLTFQHHKKQSLFLVLSLLIILQSVFVPIYLTHHATISAQFQLGSDIAIRLANSSDTGILLSSISSHPEVQAFANYTLLQLPIFGVDYRVLVVSPTFTSVMFYSSELPLALSQNELSSFSSTSNALLTQIDDRSLNTKINTGAQTLTLGINNNSNSKQLISLSCNVSGNFQLFPILLNDYLLSFIDRPAKVIPFLVLSESSYEILLQHSQWIDIKILDEAFIIKLKKQSAITPFLQTIEALPIQTSARSYLDSFQSYLPTFSTSILALSIVSGFFAGISFFIVSIILVNDLLLSRREKILVLRYRGVSLAKISRDFLGEYLLILLLVIPLGVGAGIGILIYLLRDLVRAEFWVLTVPHYYYYTIYFSVILLAGIVIDILIRNVIQRRFFVFHPSIMEGT